jgi:hypothetical protein
MHFAAVTFPLRFADQIDQIVFVHRLSHTQQIAGNHLAAIPHVVSGPLFLAEAALQSLKQSTLYCGDFANSSATVYYEFGVYHRPGCDLGNTRVEVFGNHVWILEITP